MAGALSRCFNQNFSRVSSVLLRSRGGKRNAHVAVTDDSSVIAFWHPEKTFPYEKSLPVVKKVEKPSDSILKIQSTKELWSVLKPKREEAVRQELMAMTHTTKHIWFPQRKQFRRKPKVERIRPYL
ncbi:hypothetical protein RUM44_011767 [Polyplax serrata]|uniref:Large ribosomal subunit protein mL42 n=1 Tax=Polyplax serrata TaxID=468196 RepID=A0ABR1AQZ8_POLSC